MIRKNTLWEKLPVLANFYREVTFPDDFKLATSSDIKVPQIDEVVVFWENTIPYIAVNGEKIKADVYNLIGQRVKVAEIGQFYILRAQTKDGKIYTKIAVKSY